ncbi:hypothetical protein SALBM135S_06096 [Streptomyces alboniger]
MALPELAPRSAELHVLHEDLGSMSQLDQWAEVDLVQAYVRPESVTSLPEQTSGKRDRLLEAALGVLVFVPLLITWYGLREAVRAYGKLAEEEPKQATRPFLQLRQSGFGGHLSSLGRFENVALMAVLLIALLVALPVGTRACGCAPTGTRPRRRPRGSGPRRARLGPHPGAAGARVEP